ncbi:MAG: hypothetical protein ACFCU7_06835 [Pleurocapsa sp.]
MTRPKGLAPYVASFASRVAVGPYLTIQAVYTRRKSIEMTTESSIKIFSNQEKIAANSM